MLRNENILRLYRSNLVEPLKELLSENIAVLINMFWFILDGARRANSTTAYAPPMAAPPNKKKLEETIRNMKDSHFNICK